MKAPFRDGLIFPLRRPLRIAPALVLAPAESLARTTEDILRALGSGFGKASTGSVILTGLAIIAVLAAFTAWEILRSDSRRRERIAVGWRYFSDLARQRGLTPAEVELLRRIVESGGISSADMIFESHYIYEDSLTAYLAKAGARLEKDPGAYAQLRSLRLKLGYSRLPSEFPLTSTRQLETGARAKAAVRRSGDDAANAKVAEVNEREWILALEEKEAAQAVGAGARLSVSVLRPGDGEYRVSPMVRGLKLSEGLVYLEHTRELERKQLRNWVRVDVNIPCRVTMLRKHAEMDGVEEALAEGQTLEGRLIDLSGGGACARLPSPLPQGCLLSLNFDLPGSSLRGLKAEVIRLSLGTRGGREQFEHNLKFQSLETAAQEKIVRYVFEKQRLDSQLRAASGEAA